MSGSVHHAARGVVLLLAGLLAPATGLCQGKLQITTLTLPSGTVGVPYSQALSATGGQPPYTWSVPRNSGVLPAGLTININTGIISGTPQTNGTSAFTARVRDNAGTTATQPLTIIVNNSTPAIVTTALPNGTVGSPYLATLAVSGAVSPVTWTISLGILPQGLSLAAASGVIGGTPSAPGTSSFTVRLADSGGGSATAVLSLTINPAAPPLAITTASLAAGTVGVAYSQALGASGGSPPYVWTVASGLLPAGLNLAPGGTISGTPGTAGSSSFTVRVTDSAVASVTAALSLTINPAATPLGITTTSLAAGTVGAAYLQALGASGGSPPYSWSVASGLLPAGLSLAPGGTISGTPGTAGSSSFTVRVTDSAVNSVTAVLSLTINPGAPPLAITTASLAAGTVGVAYSQALGASGGSPPYSWSLSSGTLPAGLSLSATGTIGGTSFISGLFGFSVQVTDSAGIKAAKTLAITINGAVSIQTNALADAPIRAPYLQQLFAAGGTPPYAWSLLSGAPPDGIGLDSSGILSGTPTLVGSFTFTVRVADSVRAFADRLFQISTTAGLVITTAPVLAPATVGLQYGQPLVAAGGRPPYVWSISSGGLPAGVTLNTATGTLGGVPSAAGSFQFTADVTDSLARSASKQFSLTVAAAVVISSAPQLAPATAGASYSQALAATGGTPPYLWSITSGGLPAGLSFDVGTATISGVPTLGGSFTFTAQVIDNNSVTEI